MIPRQQAWFLVVVGLVLASMSNVGATHHDPVGARQLISDAEFIYEGVVTAVDYRMSDVATSEHVALPHTFVTFEVERTFKGRAANGQSITLRFEGGPDGADRVMMVPGMPLFDVGDRDILFVRANGETPCPLVGWAQGRFRLINDSVYTDVGQEVWLTARGEFAFGPYHPLAEVTTHNLAGMTLEFESPSPKGVYTPPRGARRLDMMGLRDFITQSVQRSYAPEALAGLRPLASADIRDAFYVRAPRPEAPPAVPALPEGLRPQDEAAPAAE